MARQWIDANNVEKDQLDEDWGYYPLFTMSKDVNPLLYWWWSGKRLSRDTLSLYKKQNASIESACQLRNLFKDRVHLPLDLQKIIMSYL